MGAAAVPEVVWRGPLIDVTGYADEGRALVLGMHEAGVRIRAEPVSWGGPTCVLPRRELVRLAALTETVVGAGAVLVAQGPPPSWTVAGDSSSVGRTMFETDRIPADWVGRCNAVREVWVPSAFNLRTFAAAGVDTSRLQIVPSPVRTAAFEPSGDRLAIPGARSFVFLSVFTWSLRKGWDVLLDAYCATFTRRDDVTLVLAVQPPPGGTGTEVRALVDRYVRDRLRVRAGRAPHIVVLDCVLAAADMPRLYRAADCVVLATRGEGCGRPVLEAMAAARPVIATAWSGLADVLHDGVGYPLSVDGVVPVPDAAVAEVPAYRGHRWAEPSVDDLRELLRHVLACPDEGRRRGAAARAAVTAGYDVGVVAAGVRRRLAELAA